MIAVGLVGQRMRKGDFQFIHRFQQGTFSFILQIFITGLLGHEIRMTNYRTSEETIISRIVLFIVDDSFAEIDVYFVIGCRNEFQTERT